MPRKAPEPCAPLYPTFASIVRHESVDLDDLARRSGVARPVIEAIVAGDRGAGLAEQMRLGRALGVNPLDLFALEPDLEAALADAERQGHPCYVADVTALRAVDYPSGAA